ncbi:unnamed protein product [Calypogeia fissa]
MSEATIPGAVDSRLSSNMREARIQALDYRRSRSSSNMREARIQGALDYRRSRSSVTRPLTLSGEEEDELEGKAGDSGSARHSSNLGDEDYTIPNHTMEEFSRKPFSVVPDSAGAVEAEGMKTAPFDAHVVPICRSPPPLQTVEQPRPETMRKSLELISILAHLTTFGILGVLIRYLLEVLFGPNVAKLTSNKSALFIDLPANMLGSFFMGWVGVVFKKDIAMFSEHLAVGLSTGLMGSITTYAAMMQRNLAIMVSGSWVTGLFGLLVGVYMAQMSLVVGEDSARLLHKILQLMNEQRGRKGLGKWQMPPPDNLHRRMASLVLFVFFGGGLWVASVVLTLMDTNSLSRRTLWLACWVAPPGVWMRWYFARLNGRGIGAKHYQRWFPLGTFLVNVTASSLEAGLTSVNSAVRNYTATLLVGAINLGTLGCLSTVSTFVAEIQIMHEGLNWWRAYAYPIISMVVSLVIGILVYGVPVWCKAV